MPEHSPGSSSRVLGAIAHSLRPYIAGAGMRGSDTVQTRRNAGPLGQTNTSWVSAQLFSSQRADPPGHSWVDQSGHPLGHHNILPLKHPLLSQTRDILNTRRLRNPGLQGRLNKQMTTMKRRGRSREESEDEHHASKHRWRGSCPAPAPAPGPWLRSPPASRGPLSWCGESSFPPGSGHSSSYNHPRWK